MSTSTMTSKGQTTIPADIRAILHVGTGDQLIYVPQGDRKVLIMSKTRDVRELYGCLPKPKRAFTIEEIEEGIGEAIAEKHRRIQEGYNKEHEK